MNKTVPSVSKYMTSSPYSVGADQKLAVAESLMTQHHIRHLPVMEGGKLVGIITDRDIKLVRSFDVTSADKILVSDVAREDTFTVSPNAKLNDVARQMAGDRIGSALVVDNQKLVGIFTDVDALRALDDLLNTRLTH